MKPEEMDRLVVSVQCQVAGRVGELRLLATEVEVLRPALAEETES